MNKIKLLAVALICFFILGANYSEACDKSKSASNKSSCSVETKTASNNENSLIKEVSNKEVKSECTTKSSCTVQKTSTKSVKSCCPATKNTKLEAKNENKEVKTVAEAPSK